LSTPGEPVPPSAPDDDERARLELEKLRLETQSLRDSTDRDALTTEKLRNDITEGKRAPRRALLSTFATILLGIGTIALSGAGFVLNTTISRAADHQRDFDNYSKLTEQFSKGGIARVGAIVGFQKLLGPGSSYASQVTTVLANDLFDEADPVAIHEIVSDLQFAGYPAFAHLRDVQRSALLRLHNDAAQYTAGRGDGDAPAAAKELRDAAYVDFSRREGTRFFSTDVDDIFTELAGFQQPEVDFLVEYGGAPVEKRADWRARYVRDSATAYEGSVVLKSLLEAHAPPDNLDASETWLLYVFWGEHRLVGINLRSAYVSGHVEGADFSNADLSSARLIVEHKEPYPAAHVTSFCGANLTLAEIGTRISPERTAASVWPELDDFRVDGVSGDVPDFTAANWWEMDKENLTPQVRAILERHFPRAEQERLRKLARDEQVRFCADRRRNGVRPSPAPTPSPSTTH
jgi:hypothetical protein